MKASLLLTAASAALLGTAAIATAQTQHGQAGTGPGTSMQQGQVITVPPPEPSVAMDRLQRAAEDLRKAVQAMAEQRPGPGRDNAMKEADRAILVTQDAMVQLPPQLRTSQSYRDAQQQLAETRRMMHDQHATPEQTRASADKFAGQMPRLRSDMASSGNSGRNATGASTGTSPTTGGGSGSHRSGNQGSQQGGNH